MQGYFRAYSIRVREATRELSENELRVYMALLSFANCKGHAWPGYKALCDLTGVCNDAVRDVLLTLADKGYIDVIRKGARDPLTGQQFSNVYYIDGAVTDDPECIDDDSEPPSLDSSSNQDSYHHQRTDSLNTTKETQPKTPPPTQQTFPEVEVQKPKTTAKTGKEKTPERSSIPNPPNPVPPPPSPKFYTGPLDHRAEPLPDGDEQIVAELRRIDARLSIRTAREMVASRGAARAKWAIGHYRKQTDVYNPAGYLRSLIERGAVEAIDAEPINPGDAYINGPFADYIDH